MTLLYIILTIALFLLVFYIVGKIIIYIKMNKLKTYLKNATIILTKSEQWQILESKVQPHEKKYKEVHPTYKKADIFRQKLPEPFCNYAIDFFDYEILYPYFDLSLEDEFDYYMGQIKTELLNKNKNNSDSYIIKNADGTYTQMVKERGIWYNFQSYNSLENIAKERIKYESKLENINDYILLKNFYKLSEYRLFQLKDISKHKDLRLLYKAFVIEEAFEEKNKYIFLAFFKDFKTAQKSIHLENKKHLEHAQNPQNNSFNEELFFYELAKTNKIELFCVHSSGARKDDFKYPLVYKHFNGIDCFISSAHGFGEIGMGGPAYDCLYLPFIGSYINFVYVGNTSYNTNNRVVKKENNHLAFVQYTRNGVFLASYYLNNLKWKRIEFRPDNGKSIEDCFFEQTFVTIENYLTPKQ